MPQTTTAPALSAADFFKAKLQYESTPHALKADMEKGTVHVLDVRDRDAFAKEHIQGARNIPLFDLPKEYSSLPKDKTIVTYCWNITCALATKAALELAQKGFKVQELFGGIKEWKRAKFPIENR